MEFKDIVEKQKTFPIFQSAVDLFEKQDFHIYNDGDTDEENIICEYYMLDDFDWYHGSTKICIKINDSLVIKTGITGSEIDFDWNTGEELEDYVYEDFPCDYCKLEYTLYKKAIEEGVGQFFAEIIPVGTFSYAQEYCLPIEHFFNSEDGAAYLKRFREFKNVVDLNLVFKENGLTFLFNTIDSRLSLLLFEQYDMKDLIALQSFLKKYDINDLYANNLGISKLNGQIKIFDFSGYCSTTSEILKVGAKV